MQEHQSIHSKLRVLGIEAPSWPSETFNANSEVEDWSRLGFKLAVILDEWQKLSKEASPIIKRSIKLLFETSIAKKSIHPFEEILWDIINSRINDVSSSSFQKSCNRKIKSLQLSHAQLLSIGINQLKNSHFESAKTAFEKLGEDQVMDENLSLKLQEIVLNSSLKDICAQPSQSESWVESIKQFKLDLQSARKATEQPTNKLQDSNSSHWKNLKILLQEKSNPVILVAGMRHSGSTALFNIVRLGLKYASRKHTANYSEYIEPKIIKREAGLTHLIKIHDFRNDYFKQADIVITSRRDLRDTIASAKRRDFSMLNKLGGEVLYARHNRLLHETWHQRSDYEMSYDDFIEDMCLEIEKILRVVGIDANLASLVLAELKVLPTNQYEKTLLSATHITDPGRIYSYDVSLQKDTVRRINEENDDWLENFGYPIGSS